MSEAFEQRFEIRNDQQAEWAIAKIKEAKRDTEKWEKFYADSLAAVKAANDATISMMEGYLQEYFQTVPHKTAKTQLSYKLPSGKLVLKDQQPEYTRDDDMLIGWCKKNGYADCVVQKESLAWAELKKRLVFNGTAAFAPETGEEVPGIKVTERPSKFCVEV